MRVGSRSVVALVPVSLLVLLACGGDGAGPPILPATEPVTNPATPSTPATLPNGCVLTGERAIACSAAAQVGSPASILIVAGDHQTGVRGAALTDLVSVEVTDQYGNPTPGITVSWVAAGDSGSVNPSSSVTDSHGRASTKWTLGAGGPSQSIAASVSGLSPARFTAIVP